MATSSSQAATPATRLFDHGIELTERKSAQFGATEIVESQQNSLSPNVYDNDDHEDATWSTNIDRNDMERMGKT